MEKTRWSGMDQGVVGGTEGGRSPTGVPPTTPPPRRGRGPSRWRRLAARDCPDDVLNDLPRLSDEADYIVADGPGSQTEMSRALLLRADAAIVPCKASMLEVRALAKATEVLRQAQDIRNGLPTAVAVLSMVGENYRLRPRTPACLDSHYAPPDLRRLAGPGPGGLEHGRQGAPGRAGDRQPVSGGAAAGVHARRKEGRFHVRPPAAKGQPKMTSGEGTRTCRRECHLSRV